MGYLVSEIVRDMTMKTLAAEEAQLDLELKGVRRVQAQLAQQQAQAIEVEARVMELRTFAAEHGWLFREAR